MDKAAVITLEQKILNDLSFDFNYPSPLPFLERYLRVGGLQNDQAITARAEEYLKIAISNINFLNYKPSLIAASAIVLSYAMKRTPLGSLKELQEETLEICIQDSLRFWDERISELTDIKSSDFQEHILPLLASKSLKIF